MVRRWVADDIVRFIRRVDILKLRKTLRHVKLLYHGFRYKKLISSNLKLKNIHQGRRFVIMGNGLSLLDVDIPNIKGCVTFGCNEIFQHPYFEKFNLDYYTIGEPYYGPIFGQKYMEDVIKLYEEIDHALGSRKTVHLYHATLQRFFEKRGLLQAVSKYYYVSQGAILDSATQTNDLEKPITLSDGALFLMIAASIYMGAKEIYLLGCGYTYSPNQYLHFYNAPSIDNLNDIDRVIEFECALISRYPDMTVEKFVEINGRRYYSILRKVSQSHYEKYKIIKIYAESLGVRIVTVAPNRFDSPVFKKINTTEFIKLTRDWQ